MRHLVGLFLEENRLWMVLPLAVCGVLACWIDVRILIVAVMILFAALTMVLVLLYFYYGLSPEAQWSIMEKTVTIDKRGITLSFADERMKTHVIPTGDVRCIFEGNDVVMLMLKGNRYRCLMLPSSVVDPDVAKSLRELVTQTH